MQFSTKAFFTAALLVSSALALPNESTPGERKAYYKGGRRFRQSKRPCTTSSSVLPATTTAPAVVVAAAPQPTPEPVAPAPPPPVEDKVVIVTTTLAPEPAPTTPPPAPPPAAEPTPTPPPTVAAPQVKAPAPAPAEVKVEPTPAPAPVSAPAAAAPASGLSGDEQKALDAHNAARAAVGQKPLAWDAGLAADAKSWAQNLVSVGSLQHSTSGQRGDQGENLYWQSHDKTPCKNAADSWASEVSLYGGQPVGQGDFAAYGHYTQMIWKSSTTVGLGIANDGKGGVYVVARYNPAGNFVGQTPTR
ncbi:hypothetical protein GGTG_13073 [Gaeumannomyces tritici R3-111a-1]|uniref:SCP domain-containing protein n=1 Tax=Gaeumannomyces tritici (strain R3-111a-1) TaxID=644352 RepID=J3PHU2_GAET3|nr:hypothetical protein GGTG_13073 [Gaeumannomyces tritici R3-111a-1]EJT69454.1 hypothetical protein GGTG_13073 [Gaeumannomyces tritici R3-111a-1]